MTNLSDLIASPDGSLLKSDASRVEHAITRARVTIGFERAWPKLWPASGIMGLFLPAGLFGLFDYFPWEVHTLILLGAFGAAGYFLYENFKDFEQPTWEEGARRVERDSALEHRPITEQRDRMAGGVGVAYAEALGGVRIRNMVEG